MTSCSLNSRPGEAVIDLDQAQWQDQPMREYVRSRIAACDPRPTGFDTVDRVEDLADLLVDAAGRGPVSGGGARVAVDGIVSGRIHGGPRLRSQLLAEAAELVLAAGRSPETGGDVSSDRALLEAMALAPYPGIPLGEEWATIAGALAATADVGQPAQLDLLQRLGRFITEDQRLLPTSTGHRPQSTQLASQETVYRLFHPALSSSFVYQLGQPPSSDRRTTGVRAALKALVQLRKSKTDGWRRQDRLSPFLIQALPLMIAEWSGKGDFKLAMETVEGAPPRVIGALVLALLGEGQDAAADGDNERAIRATQSAVLVAGTDEEDYWTLLARLGQARSLLALDMWEGSPRHVPRRLGYYAQ